MKIAMMKVSDILLTLLIVVVKKYRTMVAVTMAAITMAAVIEEDVLVVHWSNRNMSVNIVKLVTMVAMYSLLLRVKVKTSMCNLIG